MFSTSLAAVGRVLLLLFFLSARCALAADCPSGPPIASIRLFVIPSNGGPPLPLNSVNSVESGQKLRYEPIKLPDDVKDTARVSIIVIPADTGRKHFDVLTAQPVKEPAEWLVPERASAIGLIFGPRGIDTKKVASLVEKHPEVVTKLSDYAEQSTRVEALVQTLSQYEKSAPGDKSLQSVLQSFSAQYGVQLPKSDDKTGSSQQVLKLLNTLAPVANGSDLPSRSAGASKAGGLAESVAAVYFGAPLGLAIGGASLVQTLHSSLFPPTTFRSAFAEATDSDGTNLCTAKTQDGQTRARIDYLWMSRIPNQTAPQVSLVSPAHLPVGMPGTISVSAATVVQLENLARARDWQLVSGGNVVPVAAKIEAGSPNDTITLDFSHANLAPGQYQLAAKWDWTPFQVTGNIDVHALGNIDDVRITPDSQDALVAEKGPVQVLLTGTDFEFVESVALLQPGHPEKVITLLFTLPKGQQQGYQQTMRTEIDTKLLAAGTYALAIKQANGETGNVTLDIHPPNPELTPTPLRVNIGEPKQDITLNGKHLERIESITSAGAEWVLAPVPEGAGDLTKRSATVILANTIQKGDQISAEIAVAGLNKPLEVDNIARVAGPRPKITNAVKSFATQAGIQVSENEIPAGIAASFAIQVQNVDPHSSVALECSNARNTRRKLRLAPGDKTDSAELDMAGEGSFFLSIDPGMIGDSGCDLMAQVIDAETGASEPFVLGRVTRLPRIQTFAMTDEKIGEATYAASLTGQDLQLIEKTAWSTTAGETVQGIPTPIPGSPQQQTLKITMPWPPPSPKAPLYIWLRGETQARQTNARY